MNKIGLVSAFDIAFTSTFVFAFIKNSFIRKIPFYTCRFSYFYYI
jgi:hypothetical protein